MKRYGNLWKDMISFEALLQAAQQARRGKRHRPVVSSFEFHLERELCRLHHELSHKTWRPGPYRSFFIHEPKKRQISAAWGIKDYFRWFWDEPDAIAGREFFDHWYNWAIRSRLEPMKKVARMLKNRLDKILSWFRHRITNSNAEGFNSRIQSIKSNARGFKSFQNYRIRILFFCGKLDLKPALSCH